MVLKNKVLVFVFSVTVLSNALFGGGILWNEDHLQVWRDRSVNGPYKSAGDAFDPLIPGEWSRIVANKNTFASNPQADRRQTWVDIQDNGFAITEHIKMLDAAFYALVKEDAALATVIKDELMWHATRAGEDGVGMQISPTRYLKTDSGNWWNPGWMTRMLITADFVKDSFSAGERTTFNAWISDWAYAIEHSINTEVGFNFNNRYDRDYTTGLGYKALPGGEGFTSGYAYKDASGVLHNQIAGVARYYNNRKAIGVQFFGLAGVFLNDPVLKDRGKLYVEEWIRFSVYPDGSVGEFERNDSTRQMRGLTYNGSNLETATWIAEALRLDGDPSLYNYSTTDGIWGTECTTEPAKTLKLAVDTHLDLIENIKLWYLDSGSITTANRIDNTDEESNYYWVVDINFAPIANRYWDDERIRKAYRRENPTSVAYSTSIAGAGSYGPPWGGTSASVPSLLFMFADMEGVGTGPVTPPVEPPATDGLLSTTQWQNRSIELQAGQFSAEYDVVPNVSNMNGTTGLSLGNAAAWDDLAVIVGFSEAGEINVRNGGVYNADSVVNYTAGNSYHFRIVGDIPSHTYSVYVAEEAGPEILLANNYAFRTTQSGVSSLDTLAVVAATGSHTVSNFTIREYSTPTEPEADADNLPDEWEIQYFGGTDVANGGEDEDFDGDGVSNYDEWVAGTDPSDATDLLELKPVLGVSWTSVSDRSYEIEYSDDNWKTFVTSETLLGSGGQMVWVDPSAGNVIHKRQYRVQAINQ